MPRFLDRRFAIGRGPPEAALHAFEVFDEVMPVTSPMTARLLHWLDAVALLDPRAIDAGLDRLEAEKTG